MKLQAAVPNKLTTVFQRRGELVFIDVLTVVPDPEQLLFKAPRSGPDAGSAEDRGPDL